MPRRFQSLEFTYFFGVGAVEPYAPVDEAPFHVFIKVGSEIKLEPSGAE